MADDNENEIKVQIGSQKEEQMVNKKEHLKKKAEECNETVQVDLETCARRFHTR